jgi:hypothetical protein
MTAIQLLAILTALLMAYLSYRALRRGELKAVEFVLWTAIWSGLTLVSLFPDRLRAIIGPLQVARLLDLVVIAGMFVLAGILFHLNRSLRRAEARLEELVRQLALASLLSPGRAPGEGQRSPEEGVHRLAQRPHKWTAAQHLAFRESPGQASEDDEVGGAPQLPHP